MRRASLTLAIFAVCSVAAMAQTNAYSYDLDGRATAGPRELVAQTRNTDVNGYGVLYSFLGSPTDGSMPSSTLVFDNAGNLYGTTYWGGSNACQINSFLGCGVVFKLTRLDAEVWSETVLYEFQGGGDGAQPYGLTIDAAGNLYGTTHSGGFEGTNGCNNGEGVKGCGTVYRLSPGSDGTWTKAILHNFYGGPDGGNPAPGLLLTPSGFLFGATCGGGQFNGGVVFELQPRKEGAWNEVVLHSFGPAPYDGFCLPAGPVADREGNLYGVTQEGGGRLSGGTAYKLSRPAGTNQPWTETVIYTFTASSGGFLPDTGLALDPQGNLYGSTYFGGDPECPVSYGGCGVIFELSPSPTGGWTESVLHTFTGGADGGFPAGVLIGDSAGRIYGMAGTGGDLNCNDGAGCGTEFVLVPGTNGQWNETVLHTFENDYRDGGLPSGGLVFDHGGHLYGTTGAGGATNSGTVFESVSRPD